MLRKGHILAISVVTISLVTVLSIEAQQEINTPPWIMKLTLWWEQGLISNDEYHNAIDYLVDEGIVQEKQTAETLPLDCSGSAGCISGYVTDIVDGDTIKVDGQSIRFALANTPEYGEAGYDQATKFIGTICPRGSAVLVDEDDGQTQRSFGRIIAVVYCNNINLNQAVLEQGFAEISTKFCSVSEFSGESWAQKHGCSTSLVSEYLENGCTRDYPYLWSDGLCYDEPEPECPETHPYLWEDDFCYSVPEYLENGCHIDYPYLWSDELCYNLPEFLENGCPRAYPYIWSDGLCYDGPEYVYDEPVDTTPSCDPSYPDVCIPPYPPDLDCDEIGYSNFRVTGYDPHGFDADYDGIGCEVGSPQSANDVETTPSCDPSYPDVCIPPYPPDLNCGDIGYSNFRVIGSDPHGLMEMGTE